MLVDSVLAREPAFVNELAQSIPIDRADEVWMGAQCSQLGAEEERAAKPAVVEGLLADPVARQRQRTFRPVPQGECEHALDAPEGGLGAPAVDCGEQDLGVGVATERIAAGLKLSPKPQEIVDLAIERDDVAPRSREHRLVTRR